MLIYNAIKNNLQHSLQQFFKIDLTEKLKPWTCYKNLLHVFTNKFQTSLESWTDKKLSESTFSTTYNFWRKFLNVSH